MMPSIFLVRNEVNFGKTCDIILIGIIEISQESPIRTLNVLYLHVFSNGRLNVSVNASDGRIPHPFESDYVKLLHINISTMSRENSFGAFRMARENMKLLGIFIHMSLQLKLILLYILQTSL